MRHNFCSILDYQSRKVNYSGYSGTATISMKEGPVSNVPITIRVSSDGNTSIIPDPTKTQGHFGNTPIEGKTNT
jgi:hypothetical protein